MTTDIRRAVAQDVAAVTYCVCQAFMHYIPRIGKQPGPMLDDYQALVGKGAVWIATQQTDVIGARLMATTGFSFASKLYE